MVKSGMLKVSSIIMLIGGILDVIVGVLALMFSTVLVVAAGSEVSYGFLIPMLVGIWLLVGIFYVIASIIGIRCSGGKGNAKVCMNMAIVLVILAVIMAGFSIWGATLSIGGFETIASALVSLIIPFLYYAGAKKINDAQNKSL